MTMNTIFTSFTSISTFAFTAAALSFGTSLLVNSAPTALMTRDDGDSSRCYSYVLVDTRATLEPPTDSTGFLAMNAWVTGNISNGYIYDVDYPASLDDNESGIGATEDILRYIGQGVQNCPEQVYAILGYSQGAHGVVRALANLTTSPSYDAIKAVFLIGDPWHLPGKLSNVDNHGGNTTFMSSGDKAQQTQVGIPTVWDQSGKVLDCCIEGDGVCDATPDHNGTTPAHLEYPVDPNTQKLGAKHLFDKLGYLSANQTSDARRSKRLPQPFRWWS